MGYLPFVSGGEIPGVCYETYHREAKNLADSFVKHGLSLQSSDVCYYSSLPSFAVHPFMEDTDVMNLILSNN